MDDKPEPREPRRWDDIGAAFARAEREHRELQRLKATGRRYACLDFDPERLTPERPTPEPSGDPSDTQLGE